MIAMKDKSGMQRIFAVSAYTGALEGDFTGRRRVFISPGDVSDRVIRADVALVGILESLRSMRAICESVASGASTGGLAERNRELDSLKENISRLSKSVAGTEFLMLSRPGGELDELGKIDESIDKISKFRESLPESDDEKLAGWMDSVLGR
jgi:hypothetical protein